jgi:hypothetical protein
MRSTVENEPFSFENYDYKSTFKKTRSEEMREMKTIRFSCATLMARRWKVT